MLLPHSFRWELEYKYPQSFRFRHFRFPSVPLPEQTSRNHQMCIRDSYCIQGCPKADTCPYNAVRLYLDDKENDWFRTTSTREANPTDEMVETALRTTQYGKCVFKCDNDVVDHQTVNMIFEDDITVTFTMNAFNKGGRFIHLSLIHI